MSYSLTRERDPERENEKESEKERESEREGIMSCGEMGQHSEGGIETQKKAVTQKHRGRDTHTVHTDLDLG